MEDAECVYIKRPYYSDMIVLLNLPTLPVHMTNLKELKCVAVLDFQFELIVFLQEIEVCCGPLSSIKFYNLSKKEVCCGKGISPRRRDK